VSAGGTRRVAPRGGRGLRHRGRRRGNRVVDRDRKRRTGRWLQTTGPDRTLADGRVGFIVAGIAFVPNLADRGSNRDCDRRNGELPRGHYDLVAPRTRGAGVDRTRDEPRDVLGGRAGPDLIRPRRNTRGNQTDGYVRRRRSRAAAHGHTRSSEPHDARSGLDQPGFSVGRATHSHPEPRATRLRFVCFSLRVT
jgi:hypothetical protein